ncbi:hypothetical protein TD95_002690 [Thielaviopsis punctulata]|uniref:Cwf19-like C-terminal domain-containing protein n=1 Tax=Thielaviopsis punctulata TaxID=72032 RepID=A0A0F4ZFZ0_9PEZI|nr:hypothetical protein TD95_002690 [Thielaviopsis punctulata]
MPAPKIIVVGNPNGNLRPILQKLTALHSKNAFSCAIVTGNIFGTEDDDVVADVLSGALAFPLSTYFTYGTQQLPPSILKKVQNDEEICENLIFLGTRGVITTLDKVRIVALGGTLNASLEGTETNRFLPVFSGGDASALRGAGTADILLTTAWPSGIQKASKVAIESVVGPVPGVSEVSDLCAVLKPSYHFTASTGDYFYEREPFLHPSDDASLPGKVTRFISMAPFGNAAKAKALYAFTLNKESTEIPAGTTASPLEFKGKGKAKDSSFSRFSHPQQSEDRGHRKRRRQASPPPGPDRCFFCLSNPNFETHMCCSIGNESYLATAKGPITTPETFSKDGIDFPCHFLLIPLPHAPTIAGMGSVSEAESDAGRTHAEMTRFRTALQNMVAARSDNKLGTVTWEISRARNIHVHWQFLATPAALIDKGLVEAGFRVEADNLKYPSFKTQELGLEEQAEVGDYFRVWIWSSDGETAECKSLVMPLDVDSRFDLQFGRRVMCKLLGLDERLKWQDCTQSAEDETADVERFQRAFKEWDFTIEE